jgi:5'-deoxynucleotidase YfbR-like HD superfamily hydrolase
MNKDKQLIGDWFLTFTGKKFHPLDPQPEDICIEDIAHALSNICRFGGHCRQFYSVAQHSVIVSQICTQATFQGLMHDATEYALGDMVRPLKISMPDYCAAEDKLWLVIADVFGINSVFHPEVKRADNTALMTERRDICTQTDHPWRLQEEYPPLPDKIIPLSPLESEKLFMKHFYKYRPKTVLS